MSASIQQTKPFDLQQTKSWLEEAKKFNEGPIFDSFSRKVIESLGFQFEAETQPRSTEAGESSGQKIIPLARSNVWLGPDFDDLPLALDRLEYINNHPYLHKMPAFARTALLVGLMALTVFSYLHIPGRVVPIVGAALYTYMSYRFMENPLELSTLPRILTAVFGGGIFYPLKRAFEEKGDLEKWIPGEMNKLNIKRDNLKQAITKFIQSDSFLQLGSKLQAKIQEKSQALSQLSASLTYAEQNDLENYKAAYEQWDKIQKERQLGGVYAPGLPNSTGVKIAISPIPSLITSIQAIKSFSQPSLQLFQDKGWTTDYLPQLLKKGPALFKKNLDTIERLDNILKKLENQHPYRDKILALAKTALVISLWVGSYLTRGTPWGISLLGFCFLANLLVCSSSLEALNHPDSDRYFYQSKDLAGHLGFVSVAIILGGLWVPLVEALDSRKDSVEELRNDAIQSCSNKLLLTTYAAKYFVVSQRLSNLKKNLEAIQQSQAENSPEKTAWRELIEIEQYYTEKQGES